MNEDDFQVLKARVLQKLTGLNKHLTYHNIFHTHDVFEQCMRIAKAEGVKDEKDLFHLKYASIYHDIGFLEIYSGHEEVGCRYFLEDVKDIAITDDDKSVITQIIMATKLPQQPITLLQKIICDADLDYLGREDFLEISDNLRKEFIYFKLIPDNQQWHELQINFLKSHTYHTQSSQKLRESIKQQNLAGILP